MRIGLGVVTGGLMLEGQAADVISMELMRRFSSSCCDQPEDWGLVSVVFHFPGELASPDFTGARTSSYFKAHRAKQIQVAVPVDLTAPDRWQELREYMLDMTKIAIDLAEKALRQKGLPYDKEAAYRVVEEIRAEGSAAMGSTRSMPS